MLIQRTLSTKVMVDRDSQRLLSVLTGIKITRPVECSTQRWFLTNVLYEGDVGGSHATTVAAGSHWYQNHKASLVSHTTVFLSGFLYEGDGGLSHATTVAAGSHWYQHHKAS